MLAPVLSYFARKFGIRYIYIYIYIFIFYLHQISARVSCIPPLNSELIGSLIGGKRSDLSCIGGHSVKSDLMSFKSLGI